MKSELFYHYWIEDMVRRIILNTEIDETKVSKHIFPSVDEFSKFTRHYSEKENTHIDITLIK